MDSLWSAQPKYPLSRTGRQSLEEGFELEISLLGVIEDDLDRELFYFLVLSLTHPERDVAEAVLPNVVDA